MVRSLLPFSLTRRARPTVPPAPARLKTSTLLAVLVSPMTFAAVRAVVSYPPPGLLGTMMRRPLRGSLETPDADPWGFEPPEPVTPQPVAARIRPSAAAARRTALSERIGTSFVRMTSLS